MKTLSQILIVAASAVVLNACAGVPAGTQRIPTHHLNPTTVAESIERLELYSRPNGLTLSARDQAAVTQFLQGYAASGSGPIFINRPAAYMNGLGVQETDRMLRTAMAGIGLDPRMPQTGEYFTRPGDPAPVVVSYKTLRTVPQDCSTYATSYADTATNSVSPNFGCFASANLAAMIQDPQQLLGPLPRGVPNAQRRQVIYDLYIDGEETGATRPDEQTLTSQDIR